MHYFAYVHLSRFYLAALDKPTENPVIIHDGHRVIEVCELGRRMGITAGFSLTEAKTLGQGATFVSTEPQDQWHSARKAWTSPLRRFTSRIEVEAPNSAYLDLGEHPDPYSLLPTIVASLPTPNRIGIGRAKWLAKLASRLGGINADWVARPDRMLAALPVKALPFEGELTRRLSFLGCRTIRDVQVLSLATLKNQFGELGRSIQLAALGQLSDELNANEGPTTVRAKRDCEDVIDRGILERLLRDVAAELARSLATHDRRARVVRAWVNGHQIEHSCPKHLRTATQIFLALVRLIQPSEPLSELVVELEAEVSTHFTQFSIADPRDPEAIADAVHRLKTVFGDRAIRCAAEVEIPRRVQVLKAWHGGLG